MNSVSVAVFPQAPALLDLLREEMFSVEFAVAKENRGEKIAISLIPLPVSSPFCVFVLIPRCAMVLPTQRCCSQLAPLHCAAGLFLNLCSHKHG